MVSNSIGVSLARAGLVVASVVGRVCRTDRWQVGSRSLSGCRGHDGLVLDGGQPSESVLTTSSVVGPLDPPDSRDPELFAGGPGAAIEDVLLQQCEERLHGRVVAGGPDAAMDPTMSWRLIAWTKKLRPSVAVSADVA